MSSKNLRALSYRKGLEDNLFENISELAKNDFGEAQYKAMAKKYHLGESVLLGTSSFYDFLNDHNKNKTAYVCTGTACMTAGTQDKLRDDLEGIIGADEIGHAACIGHCHKNSAFMFDGKTYSAESDEEIKHILNSKEPMLNLYHVGANSEDILTSKIEDVHAFYALGRDFYGKNDLISQELENSHLRGRGGAGFPFHLKLQGASESVSDQKYIVCNADEGDPGAYSDMYLMEHQAHKILFGMMIAGARIGADTGVLYIRGEYPESIRKVEAAIEEIRDQGILGENSFGIDDFKFDFKIIAGQGAYICGEETALLNSIEGLRPEVRVRPPYPTVSGLFGKPTIISNVETFANIHWILENGGNKYAALGRGKSTGTKLVSLDGQFNRPGIYEIEMGTPLLEVFNTSGQGFKKEVKAVQIGGPLGGIVPTSEFDQLSLDFESFGEKGFLLGHASVVSIPREFPMIEFLEHLMQFTAEESCGKCYPCRIGSQRAFEMIAKAKEGNYQIDKSLFDDLLETLELGSLCALGGGVPLPVKNALTHFSEELKQYFN